MSRIEVIFGGILVLAVIAAGSFALFRQDGFTFPGAGAASYRPAQTVSIDGEEAPVFTGQRRTDLCTCYETGFARGSENAALESVAYRAGYSSCRQALGADGGKAWTSGWSNGSENRLAQKSCRLYLRTIAD